MREIYEKIIEDAFGSAVVLKVQSATGGCINNGATVTTSSEEYFVKWNQGVDKDFFEVESKGLKKLKSKGMRTPEVFVFGEIDDIHYLILENVKSEKRGENYWINFGQSLAVLHKCSNDRFGLEYDNYIGRLRQVNSPKFDWVEFFITCRMEPLISMALDKGLLDTRIAREFDQLFSALQGLIPVEQPSLLHGDLWSGNFITDSSGEVCLIDPAIYYCHREAELAFTQLFGGFDDVFYHSYHDAYPLMAGYNERIDLFNLYPLMVHLNLFGSSYLPSITSIVRRFL